MVIVVIFHPDLCGGLGFLGLALRYFSPVSFAISATVAGNVASFIIIEGEQLSNLKTSAALNLLLFTALFTLPLFSFAQKLIDAKEKSIFANSDFANGMFRELGVKISKGNDKVTAEDLKLPDYSAAADINALVDISLKMITIPFNLKDLIPLWVATLIPFLGVLMLKILISEILAKVLSFLV